MPFSRIGASILRSLGDRQPTLRCGIGLDAGLPNRGMIRRAALFPAFSSLQTAVTLPRRWMSQPVRVLTWLLRS